MMAHELLRQAALILAAGWSKGADARDAAGRIIPLYVGAARATINPEAVAFSPYGAICKAAADTRSQLVKETQWQEHSVHWGNRLLDGVADPAFAAKLIKYARELEAWRISAMTRICRVVEAALIERGDAPMQ